MWKQRSCFQRDVCERFRSLDLALTLAAQAPRQTLKVPGWVERSQTSQREGGGGGGEGGGGGGGGRINKVHLILQKSKRRPPSVKERWRGGSVSGLLGQRKPEQKDVETKF